jgi:FkbM family methyltransferase
MLKWVAPEGHVTVKTKALGDMRLQVDSTFFNSFDQQEYEAFSTEVFLRCLKPGSTVVDIGANAGYFTLLAARAVGPQGKVYAFEPSSQAYGFLERNIRDNGYSATVRPVKQAVSSKSEVLEFFNYNYAGGAGSLYRNDGITNLSVKNVEQVQCTSIDDFVAGQAVDLVKMDVEGHEPAALEGMRKTILSNPGLIIFSEVYPGLLRNAGNGVVEYITALWNLGFDVRVIDEDNQTLHRLTQAQLNALEQKENTDASINILCCRTDLAHLESLSPFTAPKSQPHS